MRHLAFVLSLFALPAFAQQDFSKVEIRTEKLSDSVYMLVGAGGNLGLSVGEDAVFLVDDQFAPLTPKIEAAIAKITPQTVKFVLNTHWHGDHTGGNENLGKAGALIVAHENVRKRMSVENFIEFLGMKTQPDPRAALPVVTFTTDITFHLNGDEIFAQHAPRAHTDGDAIVHFRKSDVVHMGDVMFNKLYPFIDTSTGGTVEGVIAAAERTLKEVSERTRIIPGHGPLANRADLEAYRDMLVKISARIRDQLRAKRTLEQVQASKPTAEFDGVWGKGFLKPDKFVEMLYRNMEKRVQ
jgi:cyclase